MTDAGSPSAGRRRGLVVGLGSVDRGDDAIGTIVADRVSDALRSSRVSWVEVVALADPTSLPDAMAGMGVVVVIDAIRSGREPGTVTCHEFGQDESPLPAQPSPGSTGLTAWASPRSPNWPVPSTCSPPAPSWWAWSRSSSGTAKPCRPRCPARCPEPSAPFSASWASAPGP